MQKMTTTKLNKIKSFFKNEYTIITIIAVAAFLIRLLNIDKPFGLWYDEMLTYIFSSKSFPFGIINSLWREDFHMPLYYIYVHFWMKLLGTNDIVLRLSSVIWGVLTIPAMFYLGKTYRSKILGYILALFSCMSPILIYYSQEFRFYSMLVFLATLSLIFFLKLLDSQNKKYFLGFAISNFFILYIYTMGIIFVGAEFLFLIINICLYQKEKINFILKSSLVFGIVSIPYLTLLFSYLNILSHTLAVPFFCPSFKPYTLFLLINDIFSPVPTCIYNQNLEGYKDFLVSKSEIGRLVFLCLPTFILIFGFIKSLFKLDKKLLYFILILLTVISAELYLDLNGRFVITTRYILILFPILSTISIDGILSLKNKLMIEFFLLIILAAYLHNIMSYKNTMAFSIRQDGLKIPITTLNKQVKINKNDYILYTERSELFKKYLPTVNLINMDIPGVLYLDKTKQESLKIFSPQILSQSKNKTNEIIEEYLLSSNPTPELTNFINSSIQTVPKGGRLILVDDVINKQLLKILPSIKQAARNNDHVKTLYTKKNVIYFFRLRTYENIKTILKNNPSMEKVKFLQTPNTYNKWEITIYEKK